MGGGENRKYTICTLFYDLRPLENAEKSALKKVANRKNKGFNIVKMGLTRKFVRSYCIYFKIRCSILVKYFITLY